MEYLQFLESLREYDVALVESVISAHTILFEATAEEIYQKFYSKEISPEDFVEIMKMDPTGAPDRKGKYLDWLIRKAYKNSPNKKRMIDEDGYKIRELLTLFSKVGSKLGKQIGQINDQSELVTLLQPYIEKPESARSNNEVKRDVKQAVTKIADSDGWVLLTPHNREAACYYGKNTRWCTAAEEEKWNMFDKYNNKGPLYILIDKSEPDEKFQFHFETDQYMDATDSPIDHNDLSNAGVPESMFVAILQAAAERKAFFNALKLLPPKARVNAINNISDDTIAAVSPKNPIHLCGTDAHDVIYATRNKYGIRGKLGEFADLDSLWSYVEDESDDLAFNRIDTMDDSWYGDGFHADDQSVYNAMGRTSAIWLSEHDIDPESVCEYLAERGEDGIIDELGVLINDAYRYGAESSMHKSFIKAVSEENEYGMYIIQPGQSQSGNYEIWCNLSRGTIFSEECSDNAPDDLFSFGFTEPYNGFDGFDQEHFDTEFIQIMGRVVENTQQPA